MSQFDAAKNKRQHGLIDSATAHEQTSSHRLPLSELMEHLARECSHLKNKHKEIIKLEEKMEDHKQERDRMKQQICELQKKLNKAMASCSGYDLYQVDQDTNQRMWRANTERQDCLQKKAELPRIEEDYAGVVQKNQQLQHELHKSQVDWEVLQQAVEMISRFKDVPELLNHVQALDRLRKQYNQRLSEAAEKAEQLGKELQTVEKERLLKRLQLTMELSRLQEEEFKLLLEEEKLEMERSHILETKSKQHLQQTRIEMAIINLYKMIKGTLEKVDDTDVMLDEIHTFIQENNEILKRHQSAL